MKLRLIVGVVVLLIITSCLFWFQWKRDEPRRISLNSLETLAQALNTGQANLLLGSLELPQSIQGRTSQEQVEFLTKALRDEISSEGIKELKRNATFGRLKELFPNEASAWAGQAGM